MSRGGVPGHIRGWQYAYGSTGGAGGGGGGFQQGGGVEIKTSLLTYQVGRNRWCGNVGALVCCCNLWF